MTPLALLAAARAGSPSATHLVARPTGVLHAHVGPLTPSGQFVPRSGRPECRAHTRTLGVVALSDVGERRVCGRCTARLTRVAVSGEAGNQSREHLLASYADVTPFDLALDAWRAETVADIERVELLALLVVGFPACKNEPVVSPGGKVTDPLDEWTARARRRLGAVRDPMAPSLRAAAEENRLLGLHAGKERRHDGWSDRDARIKRLGFINATA